MNVEIDSSRVYTVTIVRPPQPEMAAQQTQGQRHDRIDLYAVSSASDIRPLDNETSLTQKMLSATTGSILTSLLGMLGPVQGRSLC